MKKASKAKVMLSYLVAVFTLFALLAPAGVLAADPVQTPANVSTISIIGTSDLHGNIYPMNYFTGKAADQGLAKVASYVKSVRAGNPNVILVDAGDTIQGTPLSYYYNKIDTTAEYPMMKAMGAMKYDTWTLGNHEFNYGLQTLNRIIGDAQKEGITVLSANTYKTSDKTNFVKPYFMKSVTVNNKTLKIGILGLTTKTISSWENESNYSGLEFNDLVDEAKKWVPVMKKEGADAIVAVIHSGIEKATDTIPENQVKAVATGVSDIDAIICGHTHTQIDKEIFKNPAGKDVIIVEPKPNGATVTQIDISVDAAGKIEGFTSKNIIMDSKIPADEAMTTLLQPYQDKAMEYINTVIGKSTGEYSGKTQTSAPSALMDLVNEVQVKMAGTQLSIAAPFSASALIPQGDIKIKDISSVYIYENFLYGIKMNGAQIKKWMESSVKYYKQVSDPSAPVEKDPALNVPDYNLDILYGATYEIDLTQPVGSRIKNLKYNGKEIQDTDEFTVAINNYRFNGGGGFMAAAGLKPGDTSIVTYDSAKQLGDDGQVRNLMIKYVQDMKTISPTVKNNWSFIKGSTTVKKEAPAQPEVKVEPAAPSKTETAIKPEPKVEAAPQSETVYVVKAGDCLSVIGKKFNVSYMEIAKINKIKNVNLIFVGQKLIIPAK